MPDTQEIEHLQQIINGLTERIAQQSELLSRKAEKQGEVMTQTYQLHDSGQREQFTSGAQRDTTEGKGRFDLISPYVLRRLAHIMELGARKYGDRNWEKGIPLNRFVDSCLRHLNSYLLGMRDEDHLGQALWNLHGLIWTENEMKEGRLPESLDPAGYTAVDDLMTEEKTNQQTEPDVDEGVTYSITEQGRKAFAKDDALKIMQGGPLPLRTYYGLMADRRHHHRHAWEAWQDLGQLITGIAGATYIQLKSNQS